MPLKMYGRTDHAAGDAAFWEQRWEAGPDFAELARVVRSCEESPLFKAVDARVRPGRLFLDGGCGPATWVKYYHHRGFPSLGIDFAERTVERARRGWPDLDVRVGDVTAMPLEDGAVHVYFSDGVVEHFEAGPEPALVEARRVTATDGWFLCAVPDASWLRERVLFRAASPDHLVERAGYGMRKIARPAAEPSPDGWEFYQYCFGEDEMVPLLEDAGFAVEETFAWSMVWGLFEVPGVRRAFDSVAGGARWVKGRLGRNEAASATGGDADGERPARLDASRGYDRPVAGLVRQALVREDPVAVPAVGALLHAVREHASNMRMYVCRPV